METLARLGWRTSLVWRKPVSRHYFNERVVLRAVYDRDCLHDHLFAAEEGVADEFAGAQRYWLLSVCHLYGLKNAVSTTL